jgi:hypothetical protein
MIALASLLTAGYAGYIGSPWWGALVCGLTLLLSVGSFHLRYVHDAARGTRDKFLFVETAPQCVAAGICAFVTGRFLQLIPIG